MLWPFPIVSDFNNIRWRKFYRCLRAINCEEENQNKGKTKNNSFCEAERRLRPNLRGEFTRSSSSLLLLIVAVLAEGYKWYCCCWDEVRCVFVNVYNSGEGMWMLWDEVSKWWTLSYEGVITNLRPYSSASVGSVHIIQLISLPLLMLALTDFGKKVNVSSGFLYRWTLVCFLLFIPSGIYVARQLACRVVNRRI